MKLALQTIFAAMMVIVAPASVMGRLHVVSDCDDDDCPIPQPHPPHHHHATKPAVAPSLGRVDVPTRDFVSDCDDPACPIPQPHPPHSRRAAAPDVENVEAA